MDETSISLTLSRVKQQAQILRQELSTTDYDISHSRALEIMARINGYKDWNTFRARLPENDTEAGFTKGDRVSGRYLGRALCGELLEVTPYGTKGFKRIVLKLDEPVDVARSEHFSALRRRISAEISPQGQTIETTSDGQPHLVISRT